jgi:cation:H+ antiporter
VIVDLAWFALGLALLVAGAEALVRGASRLAMAVGISPLVVGLTVVALGTSAPELAVSTQAAMSGNSALAAGNVVGSNIFNVLFILGVSALIVPLVVARQVIRQEVPVMVGASLLLAGLALDGGVSRLEGALLTILLVAYTVFLVRQSKRETRRLAEASSLDPPPRPAGPVRWWVQVAFVIVGLALLVAGARLLVGSATSMARAFGVSDLVIGLTIVAAGTSLPEVATSIMAAIRGQRDIAVGNVVGSNTFNILGVLGISASVAPDGLDVHSALAFDIPVMIAVAVACLPIFFTRHMIARWEGGLFLAMYVAYVAYLVLAAQEHDGLPILSSVMLYAVLPLVTLTLAILVWREARRHRAPRDNLAGP